MAATALGAPEGPPARRWRAGVEADAAPFTFADKQGRPAGFAVELLQAVAKNQGLGIDYQVLPWAELLRKFRSGEIDIICNVVDTPERREFMAFSSTTAVMRGAMFTKGRRHEIRDFSQLNGLKVAAPRDSRAHEYLRSRDWGVQFLFLSSLSECVTAVHEGRADAVFATELVARHVARTRGYTEIEPVALDFPDFAYREHFGVAPGQTALLEQLNDGLVAVNRDGTFDRIYERWVSSIRPREVQWRDLRPYALPVAGVLFVVLVALVWQRRMLRQVSRHAAALRQNEERLSLVLEGSQDGFWDWDVRRDTILRSPRWFGMLGYEPHEIPPGRDGFLGLVHADDRARVLADEQEVWRVRDQFAVELRMRAKDGEWKWILDRGKVVARDPATGSPLRITGTHTDITGRKLAEREAEILQHKMQETQRLESLGVLAGGIAHDFNNLLTVILGNTSLIRLGRGVPAEAGPHLDKIAAAANRAADLCRQLLAYAGKGAFTIERLDVNDIVRGTTHLLEVSLNRNATLEFALGDSLPAVEADPSQLQQIVMNLVMNASDAIGETPGRIRIGTTLASLRPGELAEALPSSEIAPGTYVKLEVSDTGCGMSPEVIRHIFDPFYTTKLTGRGLGLPAVLGIVRSHQGALTVRSSPGRGSVFSIYLPGTATAAQPAADTAGAAAASLGRASGVILVADDDASVRALLGELLAQLGYEPVLTADGREAVDQFAANPARYTAALVDLTMPGLDGHATLRELRRRRPGLPCVLLSGYT
ncbi:MAG: hypothetical protein C0502_03330, partial [Opitutus sp.]|nr:hypothetical protein [Opitutus sp.]